jgi:hypothetical protein
LLSSLLVCDACGALMEISGGRANGAYYRCSANRKRGTCVNRLSVREDIARKRILGAVREAIASPAGIAYLRRKLAEKLGELDHMVAAQLAQRRPRLARTEQRIKSIVLMQVDGDRSEYTTELRRDLEAQASQEKLAIAELQNRAAAPIRLPRPDDVLQRLLDLDRVLTEDVDAGREALRRLLQNGEIRLAPGADGVYTARGELLPLMIMLGDAEPETQTPPELQAHGRRFCPDVVAGVRNNTTPVPANDTGSTDARLLQSITESVLVDYYQFVLRPFDSPKVSDLGNPNELLSAGESGAVFLSGGNHHYAQIQLETWSARPATDHHTTWEISKGGMIATDVPHSYSRALAAGSAKRACNCPPLGCTASERTARGAQLRKTQRSPTTSNTRVVLKAG